MRKRFMVMGDSWGTGYVEGGPSEGGWLDVAGIDPGLRLAVNGSTAQNWASDFGSCFTAALCCAEAETADAVIVSLTGNDILQALGDGKVTDDEGHRISIHTSPCFSSSQASTASTTSGCCSTPTPGRAGGPTPP